MTEPLTDAPTIRLKPKADPRRVRHGVPWVYADDLVFDRRTKGLAPGTIARLEDAGRVFLAWVAVNPTSKIAARVLERAEDTPVDAAWIAAKVARADTLRARLYPTPHYRLAHAEADGLPGVVIDRFGETVVFQANAAWADARAEAFAQALTALDGVTRVILNGTGRAR
ncbi:MAG: RlmI/RlmK family 23S rRNA methyltransferase, partial [Shimia sp.]